MRKVPEIFAPRRLCDAVSDADFDAFVSAWLSEFGSMTFVRPTRAAAFFAGVGRFAVPPGMSTVSVCRQYLLKFYDRVSPHGRFCSARIGPSNVYFVREA